MDTDRTVREGGCACGSARYRVVGQPIMVHNCHCHLCQCRTGSTSVVNAFFETERLELLQGDLTDHPVPTGSGGQQTIRRCARCGAALWSHNSRMGTLMAAVRVGTLDDPGSLTPDAVIYTASKMPWVALPPGIPAFAEAYDPKELLPPERVDRLMALAARRKAGEG